MEQLYTGKQINELLGAAPSEWASRGKDLINRATRAGLKIEVAKAEPGKANLYRILENNFYIEGEEWRTNIFDSNYEVSSLGRYRQANNKKLITGCVAPDGYIRTFLRIGKQKYTTIAMHRIVFFSFHPELFESQEELVIDHIDGRRDNNILSNLRPLSVAQNNEARKENRHDSQEILTKLILKYGYKETLNKLNKLLEGEE